MLGLTMSGPIMFGHGIYACFVYVDGVYGGIENYFRLNGIVVYDLAMRMMGLAVVLWRSHVHYL